MKNLGCVVIAITLTAALLAGCNSGQSRSAQEVPEDVSTADYSGSGPGSLIDAKTMPNVDLKIRGTGAKAIRVTYRSTDGFDGRETEVSGAVFIPPGTPPPGGWLVIAYAHGTSGITTDCAPSLSPDIYGVAPLIATYIKLGYAVAAADYQGLGAPGAHPYLDAKTAGLNVIDSVRALRKVSHEVSPTWAAFGGSQGGAAAWAANEQASTYAAELDLVGSVSLSPAADISPYAHLAATGGLSKDQQAALVWILMGLENTRPDFPIDDFRREFATQHWDVLSACTGPQAEKRTQVLAEMGADELTPSSPEAERLLSDILTQRALPQQKAAAPMMVIYGGKDSFIDPVWTRAAIARSCAMGTVIDAIYQEGKGHGDVDSSAYVQWLGERFAGLPAPDTCAAQ